MRQEWIEENDETTLKPRRGSTRLQAARADAAEEDRDERPFDDAHVSHRSSAWSRAR